MAIWKSVQQVGAGMDFVLDENEEPRCEADGTGVGITGIAKRGKELKVLVQYKKSGGIRVAGIDIGNYDSKIGSIISGLLLTTLPIYYHFYLGEGGIHSI